MKKPILFIIIIGLVLRLLTTWGKDFWFDEAISWAIARQPLPQLLLAAAADNHPPFYYLVLHFWLKLGASPLFLRLPSLAFGLISIYLTYLVGKKLFRQRTAIFASALFALSPLTVYYSAETRMYGLWIMLILLNFCQFLNLLRKPKFFSYLLFTIYYLLSLSTHYFTILFILALDFYLWLWRKRYRPILVNLFKLEILGGLLLLPWLGFSSGFAHPPFWTFSPLIGIPTVLTSFVLGGLGETSLKIYLLSSTTPLIFRLFFALTILSFLLVAGRGFLTRQNPAKKQLLLVILFLPLFLVSLIHFFFPLFTPRSFTAFAFPFYFLVALGAAKMRFQILLLLLLVTATVSQQLFPSFKPQNLQLASSYLRENSRPADALVHTSILTYYSFRYYLPQWPGQILVLPSELSPVTTKIIGGSPQPLALVAQKSKPFWLIADRRGSRSEDLEAIRISLKNYRLTSAATFGPLELFLYLPFLSTPGVE